MSIFIDSNTKSRDQEKLHLEKLNKEIEQLKSNDLHKIIESLKGEINSISKDKVKLDHQIQTFESFRSENEQKLKLIRQQMAEHAEKITAEEQKVKSIKRR